MIDQDTIDSYLRMLLGDAEPGKTLHHALIAAAKDGPLGVPPDGLQVSIYALAPDDTIDGDAFIDASILAGVREHHERDETIHFAGVAIEAFAAPIPAPTATRRPSVSIGRIGFSEHPGAFEVTKVYAACSDGRRWNIDHVVSGPRVGTVEGMTPRVGPYRPDERGRRPQLIRYAVGLRP